MSLIDESPQCLNTTHAQACAYFLLTTGYPKRSAAAKFQTPRIAMLHESEPSPLIPVLLRSRGIGDDVEPYPQGRTSTLIARWPATMAPRKITPNATTTTQCVNRDSESCLRAILSVSGRSACEAIDVSRLRTGSSSALSNLIDFENAGHSSIPAGLFATSG